MSSSEDEVMNNEVEVEEDDLFGDEDEEAPANKPRELSDEELDSGDDEDRDDRERKEGTGEADEGQSKELRISEQTVWRHPLPNPVDNEVRSAPEF